MRTCVRMVVAAIVCAAFSGCRKATPPPPPPAPPSPAVPESTPPETAEPPETAPEAPPPVQQTERPTIPDRPVSGEIDGHDFKLARVTRQDATVLIEGDDGRGVTLAVFGSAGPFEILDEAGFGAPHVYVRSPRDAPARGYVTGYRLIYDEVQGLLYLQLPGGRGTIAGRFTIE